MSGALLLLLFAGVAAAVAGVQQLPAESYVARAQDAFAAALAGHEGELQIAPVGTYHELRLPAGDVAMTPRVPNAAFRSRTVVWVDVFVDGRLRVSRPVTFALHCWQPALIAKEHLAAKSVPDMQRLEMRTADVAAISGAPVISTDLLVGKRLRRELRPGAVISVDDLEDLPPVQMGNRISVFARVGHVVVKTAAIAERDGYAGDVIKARIPETGERVQARVTGDNTAWISEHENRTL